MEGVVHAHRDIQMVKEACCCINHCMALGIVNELRYLLAYFQHRIWEVETSIEAEHATICLGGKPHPAKRVKCAHAHLPASHSILIGIRPLIVYLPA